MRRFAALGLNGLRWANKCVEFIRDERKQHSGRGGLPRLAALARGFHSMSPEIYEFDRRPREVFLSDLERLRSGRIDGGGAVALSDKIMFERVFGRWLPVPPNVGWVRNGKILRIDGGDASDVDGADAMIVPFPSILARCPDGIVAKPRGGGSGHGIVVVRPDGDDYRMNGAPVTALDLPDRVRALNDCLLVPFVRQAALNASFFPETTNTLRVLTLVDPENGRPFVACAVQRIGVRASIPVDNWSRGGLSARIDVESGRLGPGATKPNAGPPGWHDVHPESGARIAGEVVPHWSRIRDDLLRVAALFPMIPYVGWDVIPTDDGYSVIEGNFRSDVNLLQIHAPLLESAPVRRFYRHYRVISRRREAAAARAAARAAVQAGGGA